MNKYTGNLPHIGTTHKAVTADFISTMPAGIARIPSADSMTETIAVHCPGVRNGDTVKIVNWHSGFHNGCRYDAEAVVA